MAVARAQVKINTIDVSSVVVSVDVEDHDRLIDRARIVLDDPQGTYAHTLVENLVVKIALGWDKEEFADVFEGVVHRVAPESKGGPEKQVVVTALDFAYLMRTSVSQAVEHKGKLSEIVKTIVGRPRPGDAVGKVEIGKISPGDDPTYPGKTQLVQGPGTNDWSFIQRLAIEHRCRAFVELNDGKSKFYFVSEKELLAAEPMGVMNHCVGLSKLVEFKYQRIASAAPPLSAMAVDDPKTGETASSTPAKPEASAKVEVSDEAIAKLSKDSPGAAEGYKAAAELAAKSKLKPEEQQPQDFVVGLPSDPELARKMVERDRTRMSGLFGEGTTIGTVNLRAKGPVTINGIAPWAEGNWYVTRVNHVYTRAIGETKDHKKDDRSTYHCKFTVTR